MSYKDNVEWITEKIALRARTIEEIRCPSRGFQDIMIEESSQKTKHYVRNMELSINSYCSNEFKS